MSAREASSGVIAINHRVTVPLEEIQFTYDRSSGPGGQNVNKVATRVSLRFDVANASSLTPSQKERIVRRLATRINRAGVLRVVSSRYRTQAANRRAALERFRDLLHDALRAQRTRVPTRIPASAKRKRLQDKAHRSKVKQHRSKPQAGE